MILLSATAKKFIALSYTFDATAVERTEEHAPPVAFRIWKAGLNTFDSDGEDDRLVFSARSAALLLDEQASRNRPYVFDYNHLSLLSESPEAGKAAGWHRLEVRDTPEGPELWAIDCEWTEPVALGMSKPVPEWRFFSPAFSVDPETKEVVSYTNCAITNNPRTHDLPMLASAHKRQRLAAEARRPMDPQAALMVLQDPNATPEDRAAALAILAAALGIGDAPPASESAPQVTAEAPPAPEKDMASIALAKSFLALSKRFDAIEVNGLLATRTDLPADVRAWASSQSVATVKHFLAACKSFRPAPDAERNGSPTVVEPEKKSSASIPEVGTSPVDKVLGIRPALVGKVGITEPVDGVRRITSVSPSALRNRKAGA